MSGICGIVNFDGRPITESELPAMVEPVAYRGPDGIGYQIEGGVGFAHLTLRILSTSVQEDQPLRSSQGDLIIALDGRIDNRADLTSTLFSKGYLHNHAVSDATLILAAYRCWGIDSPRYLIGDFAFAIWDKNRNWLFAARDPLAMRPFYYRLEHNRVLFATEIKQILAASGVPAELNESLVASWLAGYAGRMEETFYNGISQLTPAHALLVKPTGHWVWRYWDITDEESIRYAKEEDYVERFRELFKEATRCRLYSDFPAGILLSGGIDSGCVAATAGWLKKHEADPALAALRVYSFTYRKFSECDERFISDPLAAQFDMPVTGIEAEDHWPLKDYPQHGPDRDDPIIGLFQPQMNAALQRARTDGVRSMFTGSYGDHMVSYTSPDVDLLLNGSWGALWRNVRRINSQKDQRLNTTILNQVIWPLFAYLWPGDKQRYLRKHLSIVAQKLPGFSTTMAHASLPAWIDPHLVRRVNLDQRLQEKNYESHVKGFARRKRYQWLTDPFELRQAVSLERTFAQAGLVYTEPWSDRRIMRFVLSIPAQVINKPGEYKPIAKMAMQGIMPESVRRKTEKIVPAPFAHWALREQERKTIRELLTHSCLASYGFAKEDSLIQAYDAYVERGQSLPDSFWPALSTEMWLRGFFR